MKMIPQGARSGLLKIGARRKYNWIAPQYLYPKCKDSNVTMIYQGYRSGLLQIGYPEYKGSDMEMIPRRQIRITKNRGSQEIHLDWASVFVARM